VVVKDSGRLTGTKRPAGARSQLENQSRQHVFEPLAKLKHLACRGLHLPAVLSAASVEFDDGHGHVSTISLARTLAMFSKNPQTSLMSDSPCR
jgi:hypothetical protein